MLILRKVTFLSVLVISGLVGPVGGHAQATPYVPLGSAHYADVDALIAVGLLKTVIAGQQP